MKNQQVAGRHDYRSLGAKISIHYFYIAYIRVGTTVGDVFLDGFAMGARQDPEATILCGCLGDSQPEAHLGRPVKGKVEGILVPGLAPCSGILKDELGEETIDARTEQTAADIKNPG